MLWTSTLLTCAQQAATHRVTQQHPTSLGRANAGSSCAECSITSTNPTPPAYCKSCPRHYYGMLSCSKCTAATPLAGCKGCPRDRALWDNKKLRCGEWHAMW